MHEALIVRAGDVRDCIDAQFKLYAAPSSLPEPADDLLNSRPPCCHGWGCFCLLA